MFNHESPVRGETFVTRKITIATINIVLGLQIKLLLGNLSAVRDWGHARDYVEAMWKILQHNKADDFVIATGTVTSVRAFVEMSFNEIGIKLKFTGKGLDEVGSIKKIDYFKLKSLLKIEPDHLYVGKKIIYVNEDFFRPTEVDFLKGDSSKARKVLNCWKKNKF